MTLSNNLAALLNAEKLPAEFMETVDNIYRPLAQAIADRAGSTESSKGLLVVGINGCQGSGKSTMAIFLAELLHSGFQLNTAVLSLDDFYLMRSERETLAADIHPLLRTRGVPGTHDVDLIIRTLDALARLGPKKTVAVPRFGKAIDDRLPPDAWALVTGPVDVVIFEGWCLGAEPQDPDELADTLNQLERDRDADGKWRRFVNNQLQGPYAALRDRLDCLIMLKAPSFACVRKWRGQQERQTAAKSGGSGTALMDEAALDEFIMHYERLTRHMLRTMPEQADILVHLDEDHRLRL